MQTPKPTPIMMMIASATIFGLILAYSQFLACHMEDTEPTPTVAGSTAWATGTTGTGTGSGTGPAIDPELHGSTSDSGESVDSSQSVGSIDPIGCTDEAAAHFAGCTWAAELQNQPDCTHCTEDPCTQIACSDSCQRPLVQALAKCNATYPDCAQLLADPRAECLELCRREHTRCVYEIICEMPNSPDTSPCEQPEANCNENCDRFRSSTE